ncbi:hypothetical protein AGR56_13940 [Clostridium sp. DMHC 10]|uniref:hypothetical protein n=1 Tax=Clostridium sp. DMHC 10 TaxID=747377 RepID=UPI00069E6AB6|nr:hypothetical protein [Clostridium sp. DMHC 10]KOF57476.1 hypothetical protein AGR56_13940 [Clostridium sp. DMHC 10]
MNCDKGDKNEKKILDEINKSTKELLDVHNQEKAKRDNIKSAEQQIIGSLDDRKRLYLEQLNANSKSKDNIIKQLQSELDEAMEVNDLEAIQQIVNKIRNL